MFTHTHVLENGIKVVVVSTDQALTTTAGIFIRQGSRNEASEENGISHFMEHLLANTGRAVANNKNHIKKILSNGGILNAKTTKEITFYHGTCLKEYTLDLIHSLHELVFESTITEEAIEIEKKIILDELRNKLRGTAQIYEHFWANIYGNQTYGNWVLGNQETIEKMSLEQLQKFYEKKYISDNTTIVVLTSEDAKSIITQVNNIFHSVPTGKINPTEVILANDVGLKVIPSNSDQLVVCFGSNGPSFSEHNSTSFELLMALWGSIPSARLFQVLREKHNLVYQIQTFSNSYVQTGNYGIISNVHKNNFLNFTEILYEEIYKVRKEMFTQEEINRGVSVLKTFLLTRFNSPDFLLRLIGTRGAFGQYFFLNEMIRELGRITPEHLLNIAEQFILPENLSIIAIGNVSENIIIDSIYKKEDAS